MGRSRVVHGLLQIAAGLALWCVYLFVAHGLHPDVGSAHARGRALLQAERWMHLDVELVSDKWLAVHQVLGWLAAWEYATTYIITTMIVLAWSWWRRPRDYPWARNTLVWSTGLAIACFALWPTTPPRLLPGSGFIDVVAMHHPILSWGGGTVANSADQYAAMPSLHIGWAVWVSVVTLRARASRLGYGLALLHLAVTALVVVATANHYVLDVVAGGAVVALAIAIEAMRVRAVERLRRGRAVAAKLPAAAAADPSADSGTLATRRSVGEPASESAKT